MLDAAKKLMKGKTLPFGCTKYLSLEPAEGKLSGFDADADYLDNAKLL